MDFRNICKMGQNELRPRREQSVAHFDPQPLDLAPKTQGPLRKQALPIGGVSLLWPDPRGQQL